MLLPCVPEGNVQPNPEEHPATDADGFIRLGLSHLASCPQPSGTAVGDSISSRCPVKAAVGPTWRSLCAARPRSGRRRPASGVSVWQYPVRFVGVLDRAITGKHVAKRTCVSSQQLLAGGVGRVPTGTGLIEIGPARLAHLRGALADLPAGELVGPESLTVRLKSDLNVHEHTPFERLSYAERTTDSAMAPVRVRSVLVGTSDTPAATPWRERRGGGAHVRLEPPAPLASCRPICTESPRRSLLHRYCSTSPGPGVPTGKRPPHVSWGSAPESETPHPAIVPPGTAVPHRDSSGPVATAVR